ncbi:hypothetical protein I3400192H8_19590 [Dialister sp. i34-0019-2H8]
MAWVQRFFDGFKGSRFKVQGSGLWYGAFRHPEWRKTSYVRETLIKSQSLTWHVFSYNASS